MNTILKSKLFVVSIVFLLVANNNIYTEEVIIDWQKHKDIRKDTREIIYGETIMKVKDAKSRGASIRNKNDNDSVTVKYPKVEIKEKSVTFYNNKGKIKNEVISPRYHIDTKVSPDKNTIGIRRDDNPTTIELYDQDGTKTRSFEIPKLQQFMVANDGSFTVFGHKFNSLGGPGPIIFYNEQGEIIKSIPDRIDDTNIIPIRSLYAPNDRFIAFEIYSFKGSRKDINDYSILLWCFDKDGKELWRLKLKDLDAMGLQEIYFNAPYKQMEISEDSKNIILRGKSRTGKGKRTWVVSSNGKIIKEDEGSW